MTLTLRSVIEHALVAVVAYVLVLSPIIASVFPSWRVSRPSSTVHHALRETDALVLPDYDATSCAPSNYNVSILSRHPLVIYIQNFISPEESKHLVDLAAPLYAQSPVYHADTETVDPTIRNSSRALLPRTPTVKCIEARALAFQGSPEHVYIERLWAQRYIVGGHYTYHQDWSGDLRARGAGRISTFMVYVDCDDCEGGATQFPLLNKPTADSWSPLLDPLAESDQHGKSGVAFRPIAGNAIYWENFRPEGRGYDELLHAGLPVTHGVKVGLNIWSWLQPGYKGAE
jgi:prolyl 4-hydroxylase